MKIFLCDDEPKLLADLAKQVKSYLPKSMIMTFANGESLLEAMRRERCDILLLDIDMPEMTGLDIAKCITDLPHKPLLIFVTSHDELVYDSLLYHPFGFIRKSCMEQELEKVLRDSCTEIASREKHFNFHSASGDIRLKLQDIFYFEADGNYLNIFTEDESYRFRDTLSAVENALAEHGFVRVHKGFLVNQAAVKLLGSDELELFSGAKIPIGRHFQESAKKRLKEYILR